MMRVSDRESFLMARRIAREEGLLVGGSAGTATVAAMRVAKTLGPEAVMVLIFPDSGRGYMSKIFNDEWMIANGYIAEGRRMATVGDVLLGKQPLPPLITVQDDDVVKHALDLLRRRGQDFAVLTGEDAQYQEALADGADGGILASAHVETGIFAEIYQLQAAGEHDAATARWRSVADLTRLLFAEPSPAPIKHWLWRTGLIDSAEVRLPMTEVSAELAARIETEIERRAPSLR